MEKLGIEMETIDVVNLTPHTINVIINEFNDYVKIAPSGTIARVGVKREFIGITHNIPVYQNTYGNVEGLPPADGDTIFIVSGMVKSQCPDRNDIFAPGELIRDDQGRPIGCKGLSC